MEPRHTNRPRAWPLILTLTSGYAAFIVSFVLLTSKLAISIYLFLEMSTFYCRVGTFSGLMQKNQREVKIVSSVWKQYFWFCIKIKNSFLSLILWQRALVCLHDTNYSHFNKELRQVFLAITKFQQKKFSIIIWNDSMYDNKYPYEKLLVF